MNYKKFDSGIFYQADTFEAMAKLPDHCVDMILCDLPYGTTQNKWDVVIPFEPLWKEYWRICKENAVVLLTATQPFSSMLVSSQIKHFKYEWIWEKKEATGHLNAKKQPMRAHENVLVFYRSQPKYNPEMTDGKFVRMVKNQDNGSDNYGKQSKSTYESDKRYPRSIVYFEKDNKNNKIHPTQKPVSLFEYMIKTYTNENDIVLDNTAGSGTTAIAAINTKRRWVCIERDETYYNAAIDRIEKHIIGNF